MQRQEMGIFNVGFFLQGIERSQNCYKSKPDLLAYRVSSALFENPIFSINLDL